VHAGGQGLLDHPGVRAQGVGRAGNRQGHDHRRRLVAGAGGAGFDQATHEFLQFLEVERAMLHFIGDVVGLGCRQLLALLVASAADLRVIDRLILQPHVDDAVDMLAGAGGLLWHVRQHRVYRRNRLLGAGRHRRQHGGAGGGQHNDSHLHGVLAVNCWFRGARIIAGTTAERSTVCPRNLAMRQASRVFSGRSPPGARSETRLRQD
jgi:hypothetical protein